MPTYNKLVRDRIPEIIRQDGRKCGTERMSEAEYVQALREKLVEEAREAAEAPTDELVKEIADIYEVLDALMAVAGIERAAVEHTQAERRIERGGFEERIRLVWAE